MKDFNFFLPYIDKNKDIKYKKTYVLSILSILAIIIVGSFLCNTIYSLKLKADVRNLKSEYESSENQKKLKKAQKLNKKIKIMNKYYKNVQLVCDTVDTKAIVDSNLLYDISTCIPKEISFKTMSVDSLSIEIQGLSKKRVAIAELTHNLKNLNNIQDVHVSTINSENGSINGNYSFSLKCTLKGVDKNEFKN